MHKYWRELLFIAFEGLFVSIDEKRAQTDSLMTKFSIRRIYKNPKWTGQTAIGLEHLQSLIDLRERKRYYLPQSRLSRKSDSKSPARVMINVGGTRFETYQSTLERYPDTLLGSNRRRTLFYDKTCGEYFFDRHRQCFESILYYYQSHGRLRRPDNVPLDTFLEEITFFDLGSEALAQVRRDEELEEVDHIHLPKHRFYRHLWANLEYPQYSMTAKIINFFSMVLILLSAIELAVETLPTFRHTHQNRCEFDGDGLVIESNSSSAQRLCSPNFHSTFFIIQSVCIGFFTVEFLLRLISCPSLLNFVKSILNWIDLFAIIPYYIILFINLFGLYNNLSLRTHFALGLLRIFRFMRVFKLYRIFQHVKGLRVLASTFKESIPDFIILLSFLSLSGFLFGAAIYFAENDHNGQAFDSIPKATYYAIVTLTAVGYGELTPITPWGRALACFAAVYGISTVSMLVSMLVGRYQRVYNRKRFMHEDFSDEMVLNERAMSVVNDDPNLENPPEQSPTTDPLQEVKDDHSDLDKSDMSPDPSKVRFIIGYVSDDDSDENDGDYDKTSLSRDRRDPDDDEFIQKLAQKLLQSTLK